MVRGRYMELDDIEQYWRRKKIRDMESLKADIDETEVMSLGDCSVTELDTTRVPDDAVDGGVRSHSASRNAARALVIRGSHGFNPQEATRSLNRSLNWIEYFLHLNQTWMDAFWSARYDDYSKFRSTGQGSLTFGRFQSLMLLGQMFLDEGKVMRAFEIFDLALCSIEYCVCQQSPLVLLYLCRIMIRGNLAQEVFSQLVNHIFLMSQAIYHEQHPVRMAVNLVRRMSSEERGDAADRAFRAVLNNRKLGLDTPPGSTWAQPVDDPPLAVCGQRLDNDPRVNAIMVIRNREDLLRKYPEAEGDRRRREEDFDFVYVLPV
jgi:hypothetical protein